MVWRWKMSAVGWHIACTTITRPVHHVPALFSSHILITHQPSIACLFHCLSARVSQKSRIQTSPYLQWMLPVAGTRSSSDIAVYVMYFWPWASAHRGKWGQLTPLEEWIKNKRAKTCKKRAFVYVYVICWEQSGQAGVENGAMLTTYLFICTSECTIS